MKKRVVIFIVSFLLILLCFGCKPSNVSSDIYDAGLAALNAADAFLSSNMGSSSAESIINDQYDIISSFGDVPDLAVGLGNMKVSTAVLDLRGAFMYYSFGDSSVDDIRLSRNDLATALGK